MFCYNVCTCTRICVLVLASMFARGLVDVEVGLCMKKLHEETKTSQNPISYRQLGEYVSQWEFPKCLPDVHSLFGKESIKKYLKNDSFSSTASEVLTLAPVLACFLLRVVLPLGVCTTAVHSLLAVLDVLELLLNVRRGVLATGPDVCNQASPRPFPRCVRQ